MNQLLTILFYIVVFILVALLQCLTIEVIKRLKKFYQMLNAKVIYLIITTLLVLFINFYLSCLLIAVALWFNGVFDNLHDCISYSVDSFSTLGANTRLEKPWSLLSPMIAIIGIVCIAFVSTATYNVIQEDIPANMSVFRTKLDHVD